MNKPHKHAALIKAWADGAEIQYKDPEMFEWADVGYYAPGWCNQTEYRIKPKTIKYRTYLWQSAFGTYGVFTCTDEQNRVSDYEYMKDFIKWLGDWQEVVVD